jgi:hypothetical protein
MQDMADHEMLEILPGNKVQTLIPFLVYGLKTLQTFPLLVL